MFFIACAVMLYVCLDDASSMLKFLINFNFKWSK